MYNIGIIGLGAIADSHLSAIRRTQVCNLSCVVDINEERAREVAREYGCEYYTDYKEIAGSVDAVIINLPHYLHRDVTCWFLDRKIHVLVEKPMALNYEECLEMINASQRSGAKLAVGHIQRYFDSNRLLKQYYDTNAFGKLCMTEECRNLYYFADSRPKWFLNKAQSGGGILMNLGAHALDKLFYLMDSEVTEIHSNFGNLLNDDTIEGHAQLFLRFDNDVSSVMTFSGYHGVTEYNSSYYFTDGAVRITDSNLLFSARNGNLEKVEIIDKHDCFEEQLIDFIRLVNGEDSHIATGEYGAKIIKTLELIYG